MRTNAHPVKHDINRISRPIKIKEPSETTVAPNVRAFLPSPVSSATPDFFEDYSDKISERSEKEKVVSAMYHRARKTKGGRPLFDPSLAKFLLHISALVYENQDVIGKNMLQNI
jgi:hypothetical protein